MHHVILVNNQKNWLKSKVKEIIDWPPNSPDLNPKENVWEIIIKGILQKEHISKRSILIIRIKEIYFNFLYKHIENIVESFVTWLQKCIELEGDRTGYYPFNYFFF